MYVLAQNYKTLDIFTTLKIWNSFLLGFLIRRESRDFEGENSQGGKIQKEVGRADGHTVVMATGLSRPGKSWDRTGPRDLEGPRSLVTW